MISVIIPAYNEEKTILDVIKAVKETDIVDEVIVIDDGSEDNTFKIANKAGAKVFRLDKNIGKGGALKKGVDEARGDIVVFLDADLMGLSPTHIKDLVEPVLKGEAEMSVGIFKGGRKSTDLSQYITPFLSGQRAIKKEFFSKFNEVASTKYGVEIALTKYAKKRNVNVKCVELYDITHLMKEEKRGILKGFFERLKMYYQLLRQIFHKY